MRDTIILIVATLSIIGLFAYITSLDIRRCLNAGNSEAVCNRTFNR